MGRVPEPGQLHVPEQCLVRLPDVFDNIALPLRQTTNLTEAGDHEEGHDQDPADRAYGGGAQIPL